MKKSSVYQLANRYTINVQELMEFIFEKSSSAQIHRLSSLYQGGALFNSRLLPIFPENSSGFSRWPFVSQQKIAGFSISVSDCRSLSYSFLNLGYCCGLAMGKKWKKGQGSSASPIGDNEARLRLRQKFLMQDYKQLWMENEAKKKRLMISTKKKLELLAENKFLQRKLKSFSDNQSQTRPFKLKRRYSNDMLSTLYSPILEKYGNLKEDFLDEIKEERESKNSMIPQMVDLNQIYLAHSDDDDDANEALGSSRPPGLYLANENSKISIKDAELLKFREAENVANKVKWRNPVVSMVHHLPLH